MGQPVVIGNATLYLGDCLEILPTLGEVDAVITDPPYEADAHTPMRRTQTSIRPGENVSLDFCKMTNQDRKVVARECQRLCLGWGLYFCQIEAIYLWRIHLQGAGAKWKRAMIWRKPDGAPQFTGDRPGMGYESIACVWHGDGRSSWNGGGKHGVYEHGKHDAGHGHGGLRNDHKTQKPLKLMKALIADFTAPTALVLDPFMGSGSTGIACDDLGRRFIGIEKEPRYFDIACRRIEDAQRQQRLFI